MAERRLAILFSLVMALLGFGAAMTEAAPPSFSYDFPTVLRVDAHSTAFDGASVAGLPERSATPPVDARGAATTPFVPVVATKADVGLSTRGFRPAPGTRVRPDGVPENWRITGTDSAGGTRYYDPSNPGNSARVMQGSPNSPYPNSQAPYVRWQQNGQPLDVLGNKLSTAKDPAAHIPLDDFNFLPELFL